jgi:hypothetical protein
MLVGIQCLRVVHVRALGGRPPSHLFLDLTNVINSAWGSRCSTSLFSMRSHHFPHLRQFWTSIRRYHLMIFRRCQTCIQRQHWSQQSRHLIIQWRQSRQPQLAVTYQICPPCFRHLHQQQRPHWFHQCLAWCHVHLLPDFKLRWRQFQSQVLFWRFLTQPCQLHQVRRFQP